MTALTRDELLARMEEGRAEWDRLLVEVGQDRMTVPADPDDPDGWTTKDVIAHVMAYERWTAGQIAAGLRGDEPSVRELYGEDAVPPGVAANDTDARNQAILAHFRDVPLRSLLRAAEEAFSDLVAAVQEVPDEHLSNPHAYAWTGGMPLVNLVPQQTWKHYQQHIPALRAFILATEGLTHGTDHPIEV